MTGVGITAEYNPFHFGHEYLMEKAREHSGDCAVIAVMSGDCVQRGEPALFDKFTRAEAACRAGIDLVIELPLPWSISGAEKFSAAALSILSGLRVDEICFGVEKDDPDMIARTARALLSDGFSESVRQLMRENKNIPYAKARELVLSEIPGIDSSLLREPNMILGIEYVRTILRENYAMKWRTVQRRGNGHDSSDGGAFLCASEIRAAFEKDKHISQAVPGKAAAGYEKAVSDGRTVDRKSFSRSVMSKLALQRDAGFSKYEFCPDGLASALVSAAVQCGSIAEAEELLSNGNITRAAARRAILGAAFEIPKGSAGDRPRYARILACNERGREYLKEKKKDLAIPVIAKPADVKAVSAEAAAQFSLNARVHDFYMLNTFSAEYKPAEDWKTGPVIL